MVPGLAMGAGLIIVALILGRKCDLKVLPKASGAERLKALKDAFFGLMMPVIILGGIYGGYPSHQPKQLQYLYSMDCL